MRIGFGYDIHELASGRKLVLGGVEMDYPKGLVAHSDGDVLIHAVCDAVLGALSAEDIGVHFPETDKKYENISSKVLLREVVEIMEESGYVLGNLDSVIIMEEPKLGAYRDDITEVLAEILKTERKNINVKAKTKERLGPVGEGNAIEAYASVLLKEKI